MGKIRYKSFLLFFIFGIFGLHAQESDLSTKIEYAYFPQESSDNSFRKFRARLNYPIKLGERAYLIPGVEYKNVELQFNDNVSFAVQDLDRFQSYSFQLAYTFGLKNDWRFVAKGGVMAASNFSSSKIISDDLIYTGGVYFIKDKSEKEADLPWRIVFGIHYSTQTGKPFPLPIVNYFKTINEKWQYTLGVPITKLTYFFNKKNALVGFAQLDGFYANIQDPLVFEINGQEKIASDVTMTVVLGGFGYEHYFTERLLIFGYAGYTIYNDIRLRNDDKDEIYNINDKNSFYGRIGLEFKI